MTTLLADVVCRAAGYDREALAQELVAGLELEARDQVLEVGCGSGRQLLEVAARVTRGCVTGVDPSELMLRHARRRTERFVRKGRVQLVMGRSSDLSRFESGQFDKAYAVDVVHFWSDPRHDLRELRRVLRPGGRLLLAYGPPPRRAGTTPGRSVGERLETLLREVGFSRSSTQPVSGAPLACTLATR